MIRSTLLVGASALVAASLALAGAAQADTTTATSQVYGGGSTLIGPYLRVAADCWGQPADLVVQGAYPYGAGSESFITLNAFNYPGVGTGGTGKQNCATTHTSPLSQVNYLNSGSGNGELGVFTHDVTTDMGVTTDGLNNHQQYPGIQYGAGDYGIGLSEVTAYVNGGTLSQGTGSSPAGAVVILPPGSGTPSGTTYANPTPLYGAFIQFPISIDAVAIAFSPVYAVSNNGSTNVQYSFHINTPNTDGSGGLRLSIPVLCAIMNGAITNWNDPAIQYLNGGVSLKDPADPNPFSVPIQLDGRSDSSGTTSIFYRALAAQCPPTEHIVLKTGTSTMETLTYAQNYLPAGGKKLPGTLIAPSNGPDGSQPGLFNVYKGSTAVAAAIGTLPTPASGQTLYHGDLGYIGTDYVLPEAIVAVGGVNNFGLNVANIGKTTVTACATLCPTPVAFLEPTAKNALATFTGLLPPQSNAAGAYTSSPAAASHGLRSVPSDWAEPISTTYTYTLPNGTQSAPSPTPLANPKAGYALAGTTNAFLNTCYAQGSNPKGANVVDNGTTLRNYFTYYFTSATVNEAVTGLLNQAGFGILPAAWRTAIKATFITPTTTATAPLLPTNALNLNILKAGSGPATGTGSQCNAVTPGA